MIDFLGLGVRLPHADPWAGQPCAARKGSDFCITFALKMMNSVLKMVNLKGARPVEADN